MALKEIGDEITN